MDLRQKLEKIIETYQDKNNVAENLVITDITIGGRAGKKISYTSAIGYDGTQILLPWKNGSLFSISFSTYDEPDYQPIIESIREIN